MERNVAHRIIEEFMLLANETVAAHLVANEVPALHRVHEAPDLKKVEDFEAFITTLGYSLAAGGHTVKPKHFQKLIDRMKGSPEERPIAALMLRTMQKARYDAVSLGHFGLAADDYTHFTSPIRRYPDLVVHRMLRESRGGPIADARRGELEEELPDIARHTSEGWCTSPAWPTTITGSWSSSTCCSAKTPGRSIGLETRCSCRSCEWTWSGGRSTSGLWIFSSQCAERNGLAERSGARPNRRRSSGGRNGRDAASDRREGRSARG